MKNTPERQYIARLLHLGRAYERAEIARDFTTLCAISKQVEAAVAQQWDMGIWPAMHIVRSRNHIARLRKTGTVYHV